MSPVQSENEPKLTRIRLDPEGGYFFIYADGSIFRALKTDLKLAKSEIVKRNEFWLRILPALNEAVNEKTDESGSAT